ncbi:MAG: chemotaxis protein CheB [Desulfofustis sp.]|jgi:two-component system chemotaxis response regulator CheB|nr:chemotaxis protein CheB [Desulfofustis sp.]
MAGRPKIITVQKPIRLLVVDDSLVFRRVLRGIFDQTKSVRIIGEAANGIEALDLVLKLNPDVIIMDMEMPLMDGMTALQHLMIHKPTPTIMFSSLTQEGTARSFDAIKNGAVDFVCKDAIFHGPDQLGFQKDIVHRVLYASKVLVRSVEPIFAAKDAIPPIPVKPSDIIFCEECGTRNIIDSDQRREQTELRCRQCGDLLEVNLINKYRRLSCLSVIGAGRGGFSNLLRIIPQLPEDMGGAVLVVVHAEATWADAFADYLDAVSSIKVVRMSEGLPVEGGACYVCAASDYFCVKPASAQFAVRKSKAKPGYGPFDLLMHSVAAVFKNRVTGVILSGSELDGEKGINAIKQQGGSSIALNSASCLCKEMGENVLRKCLVDKILDEKDVAGSLSQFHELANSEATTA